MFVDGLFMVLALGDEDQTADIYIYDINSEQAQLQFIYNAFTLDIGGQYEKYINFTSFDVWEISPTDRKIIITNDRVGFIVANIQANNVVNITDIQFFNLAQFLNQSSIGLSLPLTANLSRVVVASCQQQINTIQMRLFLMINDIGIYDLFINFNSSSSQLEFLPQETNIIQIYSSYGHFQIGNQISIYGQNRVNYQQSFTPTLFAVRFYDPINFIILLAVYSTQKPGEPNSASQISNIPFITMLGGYEFKYSMDYWNFAFEFQFNECYEDNNSPANCLASLYCTNTQMLTTSYFNVYQYITINITEIDWVSDNITLIPLSDFIQSNTENITIPANIFRPIPNKKQPTRGLQWYWILLIVIGSVIIFGIVGFLIWTYQQKKKQQFIDLEYSQNEQPNPINEGILNPERA